MNPNLNQVVEHVSPLITCGNSPKRTYAIHYRTNGGGKFRYMEECCGTAARNTLHSRLSTDIGQYILVGEDGQVYRFVVESPAPRPRFDIREVAAF